MQRTMMNVTGGILLLGLLTLFGVMIRGRSPQVAITLQSPLPTVVADPIAGVPCLTASDAGFVFNFDGYVHNEDGTTTLTYIVTNPNKKDISYVAFGTVDWTRVEPNDGMTTTLTLGTYQVEWTNDRGNPGFTSVKYETRFGGFSKGMAETFTLVIDDFDPGVTVQIEAKAGKDRGRASFALADPTCDKTPPTPTPTETATRVPTATQPRSPLPTPTLTPWSPPPPPVATVTPLPISVPENNKGMLIYLDYDLETYESAVQFINTDQVGNMVGEAEILPLEKKVYPNQFSVSPNGNYLITISERLYTVLDIFELQSGKHISSVTVPYFFGWQANNQHILIRSGSAGFGRDLWQEDVITEKRTPLVLQLGRNPSWLVTGAATSNNGQKLVYATTNGIWLINPDGSAPQKQFKASDVWDWSFDDRYIVYSGEPYNLAKGDTTTPRYLLWVWDTQTDDRWPIQGPFLYGYGYQPILSPARHQLAFIGYVAPDNCFRSDETIRADRFCKYRGFSLFIADLATGAVTRVADNVGKPAWSPDGSAIAYIKLDENDQVDILVTHLDDGRTTQITDSARVDVGLIWIPR